MNDRDRLLASPAARAGIALALLLFVVVAVMGHVAHGDRMLETLRHGSDPLGYYQYLPALLGTHTMEALPWSHQLGPDRWLNLFTIGVALMQAPFFLGGALFAWASGQPVDGYSLPFAHARILAAAFYLAAGSLLLFHALRARWGMVVAWATPVVILLTTNLWHYAVHESGMSHVYSFFLFAWLLFLTVRMVAQPRADRLVGLIACTTLIVLVRPLNGIALLLPLCYGAPLPKALLERWRWVREFPGAVLGGLAIAAVPLALQSAYWLHVTGEPILFTYGKKGEGFDWLHPHLWDVLFSHQGGWFIYTPVMLPVMAVMVRGAWRRIPGHLPVLIIWACAWYVYSSWWIWWLGGAFGHRGFVEHYAFLSLGFAGLLAMLPHWKKWARVPALSILAFLAFVNIRMSALYASPWDGEAWTWDSLFAVWEQVFRW